MIKKGLCLALCLLLAMPGALADFSRFLDAPKENLIYESHDRQAVSLLYGDARYVAGAVGMMYADVSTSVDVALPMLVLFFVHDGMGVYDTLQVATDRMEYRVDGESNLSKSGIQAYANAFHIAVGPDSIEMLRDMAGAQKLEVTCGPEEDRYEILMTAEKQALLALAVQEYESDLKPCYEAMSDLDRKRIVLRPAPQIQAREKGKDQPYQALNSRSTGPLVKRLQRALIDQGYLKGAVDGVYSKSVTEAVKKFQNRGGISPSGKADEKTLKKLYAREAPWTPPVSLEGSALTEEDGRKTLRFRLVNRDCEYTVTRADVLLRLLDEYGNPIALQGTALFSHAMDGLSLAPGDAMDDAGDGIPLDGVAGLHAVEAGVARCVASDGTVIHVPTERIEWLTLR